LGGIGVALILVIAYFVNNDYDIIDNSNLSKNAGSNLIQTSDYSCIDCNILLISIDTLRAENLGALGYVHETSPNLSKLAKDGILFTNAYSQIPFTPPSHWSMLTGLRPYHHQQFSPSANGSDFVTLPDIFSDNGYQTYGIVSARILSGINGEFDDFTSVKTVKNLQNGEATTEKAVTILEENQNSKFFLFLHYYDTHYPYTPPEDYDIYDILDGSYYEVAKKFSNMPTIKKATNLASMAAYDGEILYNDAHVRIVMDKLEEMGLAENTIVIVTSDHGECFGDRIVTNGEQALQSSCMKHGYSLLEKELHVPLIVYNPKSDLKDIVIDDVVESVDIFPTILAMVGIGYDSEIDGESLVGLFTGGDRKKHFAISQLSGGLKRTPENSHFSIIIDDSKLVIQKVYDGISHDRRNRDGNWNVPLSSEQSLNHTIIKELYKLTEYETLVSINENIKIVEKLENIFYTELGGRTIDEIEEEATFTESDEDILKRFGYIG